ncbi:MAG: DMT family transporter [Chloroflexi bacterium]|nr:DMT family transporter [Chloroflexota bacterium]
MSDPTMASKRVLGFMQNAPLVVMILLLVDSLHFVFARLLLPYMPAGTSAMFVLGVATVEVGVFLAIRRQLKWSVLRQHVRFFLVVGFLVAVSTNLTYLSVSYLDPGTASLLAQTSTIFALGFGVFWLKDRLSRPELLGTAVTIMGSFVISFQPGGVLRLGALIVLSATLTYSFHAAVVKKYGSEIDFANFFFLRVAFTTMFLVLLAGVQGQLTWVTNGTAWLFLLIAGTVDVVISRVLYYLALRRLQISFHAILLTLSPVITILWSLALFGERPSWQGFVGGTAVIIGIIIVTSSKRRRAKIAE